MAESLVPVGFIDMVSEYGAEAGIRGVDWARGLPRLVDECLQQWQLTIDGDPMYGYASLVLPVRREAEPAILKISWPHPEARHEHLALRAWDGHHAVRLLAADPSRWAMLLERLDWRRTLLSEPIDDACARIGELLGALDVPALPQLDTLSDFAEKFVEWLEGGTPTLPPRHEPPLPPRFLDQARGLLRDLTSSPDLDSRLVNTDLHYANVLYGRDGQWLAIDPKPMAADPAYAVAPAIRTRWHEVVDGSVRWNLRRRLEIICETSGVNPDRARAWTIVREVDNARDGGTGPDGYDRRTMAVAMIKAMQD